MRGGLCERLKLREEAGSRADRSIYSSHITTFDIREEF
jgi:hypothetical protein